MTRSSGWAEIRQPSINMTSISYAATDQISVRFGVGEAVAVVTVVAAAQQFGSALWTRYTHQPLKELIHALNDNTDISPRRYHGDRIYDEEKGRIMTMQGEIKAMAMGKVVANEGEHPTPLGTVIICLSASMSKETLSSILATSIMLHVHNTMDRSMEGTIRILQGKIDKYAVAILSRDRMCGKLQSKRDQAWRRLRGLNVSGLSADTLFLPPQNQQEEGDFVEFLAQIWSAQADGVQIFTRSVKLLGLALLLSEYGWQIDTFVEPGDPEDGAVAAKRIPIKSDLEALSVTYSVANTPEASSRRYVENHHRYARIMQKNQFYPTASCSAGHMGEVSGLSLANT